MTETKKYYRSLNHLENEESVVALIKREFPEFEPEKLSPVSRRRFVQLLGASAALASASACRWETEKIVDVNTRPDNRIPGVPQYFATAMELSGVAIPLQMTTYDGRPIKAEGNPRYAANGGAASAYAIASVLSLYDPDRNVGVVARNNASRADHPADAKAIDFATFVSATGPTWTALRGKQGEGLRVLSEASSSDALMDVRRRFEKAYPKAKWHEYEAASDDEARTGSQLAFGAAYRPLFKLEDADVVLCLDCDLLGQHPNAVANQKSFAMRRDPDKGSMNRLYVVESNYSVTGAAADHRLPLRSSLVGAFLNGLEEALGVPGAPGASPLTGDSKTGLFLRALAGDLNASKGRCVIAVGSRQPAEVQARVHQLNQTLGNLGKTVTYVKDAAGDRLRHVDDIKDLASAMEQGQVDTLVILGGNPAYDAPADVRFSEALAKVKTRIHLAQYDDETSALCDWHLPMSHYLESWGDARAYDGTHLLVQPMISPLYKGKSAIELVAMLAGDELADGHDLVRRAFDSRYGTDEKAWRRSLRDGIVDNSKPQAENPQVKGALKPMPASGSVEEQLPNGQLEIDFIPCPKLYDGRFTNNGWLMETPDFMTRLTWDNVALIGPSTAKALGVTTEQVVNLKVGERSLDCVAYVMPGHAPGAVTIWLGYGRTHAGGVGGSVAKDVPPVGADSYKLRTTDRFHFGSGLTVTGKSETYKLAQTQEHHMMDEVGMAGREERVHTLIHEADVREYKANPESVHGEKEHGPELVSLWDPPEKYETGHKWGLSIDLSTCTGCNACVVACQAENNVPVVGKERVWRNREMHWLRIDRYFSGDVDDPAVVSQPVMCQQCENAPCEEVCPVGATMHSKEGLNDMVYNRCVGTRYCSNNCPFKVRRFNFFNYHLDVKEPENEILKMLYNPEVTVRARGVMEKCTYCVHRIRAVTQKAKNERREVKDGEIVTACQQACPSNSIVFGDLNDKNSRVSKKHEHARSYAMLEQLNIHPRTQYMARISNKNPALAKATTASEHGGH